MFKMVRFGVKIVFLWFSLQITSGNDYEGIIDYTKTKVLTITATNDTFFGFSIFLQKGEPPIAIVGAPRFKPLDNNRRTGAVFRCNLGNLACDNYNISLKNQDAYPISTHLIEGEDPGNGNFLGAVLDGDSVVGGNIFTCAPKLAQVSKFYEFTAGKCIAINNDILTAEISPLQPKLLVSRISTSKGEEVIYNEAYAEAGFDFKYFQGPGGQDLLIFGTPGKLHWTGGMVLSTMDFKSTIPMAPHISDMNLLGNNYEYFGYAVSWGNFAYSTWYVAGAPRANNLKGQVFFLQYKGINHIEIKGTLFGEEVGQYFGSALLVIHKGVHDDILVGAPMSSGRSWDEGCVYYYRNTGNGFHPVLRLKGRQSGSRFGSVMANLFDLDLNGYQDVAISAPYEDDGVVYIYFGSEIGFNDLDYHRITPKLFEANVPGKIAVRGFGLGLSRGTDMDGNLHTEFAIGAYKSGQVFYFTPHTLVNFVGEINASVDVLSTTVRNFSLRYSVEFLSRNKVNTSESFVVQLSISDDRVILNTNATDMVTCYSGQRIYFNRTVFVKSNFVGTEPIRIDLSSKLLKLGSFKSIKVLSIPILHGCGNDNICDTDLAVTVLKPNKQDLTRGVYLSEELHLEVLVQNYGETSYYVNLFVTLPPDVLIVKNSDCDKVKENLTYVCPVARKVDKLGLVMVDLALDISEVNPFLKELEIGFDADSFGNDIQKSNNRDLLKLFTILRTNPHVDGESRPSQVLWNQNSRTESISQVFSLGNDGPDPLADFNLTILVPFVMLEGGNIVDVDNYTLMDQIAEEIQSECSQMGPKKNITDKDVLGVINCTYSMDYCLKITCEKGYLSRNQKLATVAVKMLINFDYLSKFVKDTQDEISLVSSFTLHISETRSITTVITTPIQNLTTNKNRISPWIYVTATILGIMLLGALVCLLYKFDFFRRDYHERLRSERIDVELLDKEEDSIDD